jgi:predicted ester cyclase
MTNKTIATAWFAAIDNKDFAALRSLMAANHEFHNPMTPQPLGPAEHLGMIEQMTSAFTGRHELTLLVDDGSHIAVRGRWTGKHTGAFNGIAATGKPVDFTFIDIMEIKNSKVAREAFEMNPMTFMTQIGAMKAA